MQTVSCHLKIASLATVSTCVTIGLASFPCSSLTSNSSDGGEVPSVLVRFCLFTVTMLRFDKNYHEAMEKYFSWLALQSGEPHVISQHDTFTLTIE